VRKLVELVRGVTPLEQPQIFFSRASRRRAKAHVGSGQDDEREHQTEALLALDGREPYDLFDDASPDPPISQRAGSSASWAVANASLQVRSCSVGEQSLLVLEARVEGTHGGPPLGARPSEMVRFATPRSRITSSAASSNALEGSFASAPAAGGLTQRSGAADELRPGFRQIRISILVLPEICVNLDLSPAPLG